MAHPQGPDTPGPDDETDLSDDRAEDRPGDIFRAEQPTTTAEPPVEPEPPEQIGWSVNDLFNGDEEGKGDGAAVHHMEELSQLRWDRDVEKEIRHLRHADQTFSVDTLWPLVGDPPNALRTRIGLVIGRVAADELIEEVGAIVSVRPGTTRRRTVRLWRGVRRTA